jgi:hypothetical protein
MNHQFERRFSNGIACGVEFEKRPQLPEPTNIICSRNSLCVNHYLVRWCRPRVVFWLRSNSGQFENAERPGTADIPSAMSALARNIEDALPLKRRDQLKGTLSEGLFRA